MNEDVRKMIDKVENFKQFIKLLIKKHNNLHLNLRKLH